MSDRVKLARAIAARSEPRFIEIKPEPRSKLRRTNDWVFIEIPRARGGGKVPFTETELTAMRGGLTAEEYRLKTVRKWSKRLMGASVNEGERGRDIPVSLPVYIQDTAYSEQDDQSDWEERSTALKAKLEKEFGCAFHETDIWPGASLPGFVVQLAGEAWPYLAMALYVFFKGTDIRENLDAWPKLCKQINPFRKYKPYFNREGSAVLALRAVTEALGHEPSSIRLVGYRVIQVGEPPLDWNAVTGIDDGPTELYIGWVAHLFRIETDGRLFNVAVEGNEVTIVEG